MVKLKTKFNTFKIDTNIVGKTWLKLNLTQQQAEMHRLIAF